MKKNIVVTGGTGRFGNHLKSISTRHKLFFPTKNQFNILNVNSMLKYLKKNKTSYCYSFSWIFKTDGVA